MIRHRYFTYVPLVIQGMGIPPDAHITQNFPRLTFRGGIARAPHDGRLLGQVTYDDQQVNTEMLTAALSCCAAWGAVSITQTQAATYLRTVLSNHTVTENADGTISFVKNP